MNIVDLEITEKQLLRAESFQGDYPVYLQEPEPPDVRHLIDLHWIKRVYQQQVHRVRGYQLTRKGLEGLRVSQHIRLKILQQKSTAHPKPVRVA